MKAKTENTLRDVIRKKNFICSSMKTERLLFFHLENDTFHGNQFYIFNDNFF